MTSVRAEDQRPVIPKAYRAEAMARARMGRPVSAILRDASVVIERHGWAPRGAEQAPGRRGRIDVLTAIRTAAFDHLGAPLKLVDYYALLVPIASVLKSSFAVWECRPELDTSAVLAMLEAAIAFSVCAEQSDGDPPFASGRLSVPRLN